MLRRDLRTILDLAPSLTPDDPRLLSVTERLTAYHIKAVQMVGRSADLIGFHGQTILHQPHNRRTWQVGDAQQMADRLGIPVAYDFRSADVAAGGQGAPLVPAYHQALAASLPRPLAILNIGGVANVTWIGRDASVLAFDTGPGNGPLDDWIFQHTGQAFDPDGALANSGQVSHGVLAHLLAHPYFGLPGPKSLDRLDFRAALVESRLSALSTSDGAATLVRFIVASAAAARFPEPPLRWLVCGGGRHNQATMAGLRQTLDVPVEPVEAVGWNGDALEAQCFGFLAARVAANLPLSFPTTTGVPTPTIGGRIAVPKIGRPGGDV
jgi:anhydro-N-acetylmuramic acid kinase